MIEFIEAIELCIGVISGLRQGQFYHNSPLDEIVVKTIGNKLAYIGNPQDTYKKFGFDFWGC